MKSKAFKLKEKIARYMYEYIGRDDVSIWIDNGIGLYPKWEININEAKGGQDVVEFFSGKVVELENILGFEIVTTCSGVGSTLLWNKEKEEKWKKGRIVKFPNKKEKFYLVQTDTDVFGLYRNLDEAETLKMHLEIVLGKKVYIKKIN